MKSTVEHLSPTRVRLAIEVPFDELKPTFDQAYKKIAQQVRIPGFRPGKAPARILDQRLGRGVVLEEVVNTAVPEKYGEAVGEAQVTPLGQPEIEVTSIDDGDKIAFTAEVDVRPEIELPDYSSISVEVDSAEVTDSDVEDQLTGLQARFGTLTGVQRPAATDDFVVIDLSATVGGEPVEEAQTSGMSHQVGSGQLIEGLDEALVGMSAGETKTFTTKLVAGEHAGQEAEVTVSVQTVKERQLPEADDEFAQLASEFDTLDELKADLRERQGRVKKMEQAGQARDKVLDALLEAADIPVPESVVAQEVEVRAHEAVHEFDHDEDALTTYVESQGQTREEFDAELRTSAERAVKTQLLLDEVAEKGEVQVDQQELMERIFMQAQRFGISPEEYIQQAQQANQLGAIFADVRRGKALATVVQAATITGPDGAEVDLSELFGPATPEDAEAAAEVVDETATVASGEDEADTDTADAPATTDEEAPAGASTAPQA
ncbi:trigger factor [Actinomycetospora sp. TBRC 11914]|uniref:trigger factor n=1 Tax=Actinomycetospora sp. TBRC 11914 TaxID=2729387 RepID=UPI00145D7EF3|nr:trigger factor [Actinomycetospora sp. TBRC 11914]NMO91391.1 trigger factor [Actinomycetospora sp. TBRC 11914]